jgi:mitochondrial chaperone BCS1
MSVKQPRSSSLAENSWLDIAVEIGGLVRNGAVEYWRGLVMASLFPLVGSAIYHYARTVVHIGEGEQAMWLQTWLMNQHRAIKRVRRLHLASHGKGRHGRRSSMVEEGEDEKEEENEGRFAPPKLEFQPARGISVWAWVGWWPVTVTLDTDREHYDDFGRRSVFTSGGACTITVWLSPKGKLAAKNILLKGREMWLEKRAKKTEILTYKPDFHHQTFDVKTRPSRPLSSIIVEGNIKDMIKDDSIRFLNSEKWYISKGIPYRRGYLLYGPPGCGKTSLVTALAGELRLPIVLIPLNSDRMDDLILAEAMGSTPKDCIIFIEDIDSALPREAEQNQHLMARMRRAPVTLSGLLNAIDGVGAQEGRLLFMSTNHRDRLDEALIRPGRVDFQAYLGKASKAGASELFDQFFVGDETTTDFRESAKEQFLARVESGVHSFASLQGVLMKSRDDVTTVVSEMDKLLESESVADPEKESAWETVATMERLTKAALEKETNDERAQSEIHNDYVVKRLTGSPTDATHDFNKQEIVFEGFFLTYGVADLFKSSGVLYYEISIQNVQGPQAIQLGFAKKDTIEGENTEMPSTHAITNNGCGDYVGSWSIDGFRRIKFENGEEKPWNCKWKPGIVIGLAANVDAGMIAVSVDGNWEDGEKEEELGIVFKDDSIKDGVYPSFSAFDCLVKYCFDADMLMYGPPPTSLWGETDAQERRHAI